MSIDREGVHEKIATGLGWMLTGSLGQYAVQTLTLLLMARFLTPKDFGIVGAAMVAIGFLAIFSEMGVGPALVQKEALDPKDIGTANVLSVGLGTLLALAIYTASDLMAAFFRIPALSLVLKVMCLMLPAAGISVVGQALLQRNMHFRRIAFLTLISYGIAYLGVGIPLVLVGSGVWALVGAYVAQSLLMTVLVVVRVPESHKVAFSRRSAAALLNFGAGFSLARVSNYFSGQGDNIIAGRFLGAEALGLYGRAYQLMTMPAVLLGTVLDKVFFPVMAGMQRDNEGLAKIYLSSLSLISLLAFPLSGVIAVFSEEIVVVLLGKQWAPAASALRILAFCLVFRVSYKMSDSLVRAKGAVYRRAWRQMLFAISIFLFSWIGHFWGINGIASGVALSITFNFVLMLLLSQSLVDFDWGFLLRSQGRCLALGCFVAAACLLVKLTMLSIESRAWATLLVGAAGAVCAFGAGLRSSLFRVERGELALLERIMARYPYARRLSRWVIQ